MLRMACWVRSLRFDTICVHVILDSYIGMPSQRGAQWSVRFHLRTGQYEARGPVSKSWFGDNG